MNSNRAPKQWSLTKNETITTFEAWRQNLQYSLSLDANFAPFLANTFTWVKKSSTAPNRGLESDGDDVPTTRRRTAFQKNLHLDLMLGQIANFCPAISRSSSQSISSVWQAIRAHYGFQSTGAGFLDFSDIKLEVDEPDKNDSNNGNEHVGIQLVCKKVITFLLSVLTSDWLKQQTVNKTS